MSLHNTFDRWRFSNSGDPGPLDYKGRCSDFENERRRKLAVTKAEVSTASMLLSKTSKAVASGHVSDDVGMYYRTGMDARPEEFPGPRYEVKYDISKERERNRPATSRSIFGDTRRFHEPGPECNFRLGPGPYDRPSTIHGEVDPYVKTSFTNTVRKHPADLDSRRSYPAPGSYRAQTAIPVRSDSDFTQFSRDLYHSSQRKQERKISDEEQQSKEFWLRVQDSKYGKMRGTFEPSPGSYRERNLWNRPSTSKGTFGTYERLGILKGLRTMGQATYSPGPSTGVITNPMLKMSVTDQIRERSRKFSYNAHRVIGGSRVRSAPPARSPTRRGGGFNPPSLSSFKPWNITESESFVDDKRRRRARLVVGSRTRKNSSRRARTAL